MRVFFGSTLGAFSMSPFEKPGPSSATAERCLLLPSGSRDYSVSVIHCQSKFVDGAGSCTTPPHFFNFGPFTICRLVKIAHLGRIVSPDCGLRQHHIQAQPAYTDRCILVKLEAFKPSLRQMMSLM